MPLIDAGFPNQDGTSDFQRLLTYGPTVSVIVGPYLEPGSEKPEDLKTKVVPALVDTGAWACMIDSNLAEELSLVVIDKAMIAGVSGPKEHKVYMAGIIVPQLDINQFGRFVAADLKHGGQEHEVLLGRDFLRNTVMIYDGLRSQVTIASIRK